MTNLETKTDIKSMTLPQLKTALAAIGAPPYRASQLYHWLHVKIAGSFSEMANLPAPLRQWCLESCRGTFLEPVQVRVSAADGTRKFLFRLEDGHLVESVLMKYRHGNSVCISSQVGCRMGCAFCASTLDGLERSLTPAEMLEQIYAVSRHTGERVTHVVVMGMGEPLDNYDNLLTFLAILTDKDAYLISQRNITVSTCGLVPEIRRLAAEKLQITLALSLHAPTDTKRSQLMPIARRYPLARVMDACAFYFSQTGRRITFEYSLISGRNDSAADASQLAGLAAAVHAHVNLIPVNPVAERDFTATGRKKVLEFKNELEKCRINVTIRREMGRDIDGACGQLRRRHLQEQKNCAASAES